MHIQSFSFTHISSRILHLEQTFSFYLFFFLGAQTLCLHEFFHKLLALLPFHQLHKMLAMREAHHHFHHNKLEVIYHNNSYHEVTQHQHYHHHQPDVTHHQHYHHHHSSPLYLTTVQYRIICMILIFSKSTKAYILYWNN